SRRGRWPAVLLAVAALLAAASLAATQHWALAGGRAHPRSRQPSAAPRAAPPKNLRQLRAAVAEERAAADAPFAPGTLLLLNAKPRLAGELRKPIAAPAAILVDADTGAVLWSRRAHQRRPIASTTKIMTGVLALEHLSLAQTIRINPLVPRVALGREGLRAHERVP